MATPAARFAITTVDKSATDTPLQLFPSTLYHDFTLADDAPTRCKLLSQTVEGTERLVR